MQGRALAGFRGARLTLAEWGPEAPVARERGSRVRVRAETGPAGSAGTFHAKMDSIKDRNGMDLTEAEDIKKMWQEYTKELYKKRSWGHSELDTTE